MRKQRRRVLHHRLPGLAPLGACKRQHISTTFGLTLAPGCLCPRTPKPVKNPAASSGPVGRGGAKAVVSSLTRSLALPLSLAVSLSACATLSQMAIPFWLAALPFAVRADTHIHTDRPTHRLMHSRAPTRRAPFPVQDENGRAVCARAPAALLSLAHGR